MNSTESSQPHFPHWMRGFLLITAVYNLAWGFFMRWFPDSFYQWVTTLNEEHPKTISYQGAGVIAMGLVYFASALYPKKLWPAIALGAITKAAGAVWFYTSILGGNVGKTGWFHLIMNDIIWIPILSTIAYKAYQFRERKI